MKAIRNLQDKTLKPILRHESTQAAAISLLPATSRKDSIVAIERPDPPRIPSARSESTRSSSSKSQTARSTLATPDEPNPQMNEVVAVWFEDDGFGHPVKRFLFDFFFRLVNDRFSSFRVLFLNDSTKPKFLSSHALIFQDVDGKSLTTIFFSYLNENNFEKFR